MDIRNEPFDSLIARWDAHNRTEMNLLSSRNDLLYIFNLMAIFILFKIKKDGDI